jgi:hypothetical protein
MDKYGSRLKISKDLSIRLIEKAVPNTRLDVEVTKKDEAYTIYYNKYSYLTGPKNSDNY